MDIDDKIEIFKCVDPKYSYREILPYLGHKHQVIHILFGPSSIVSNSDPRFTSRF